MGISTKSAKRLRWFSLGLLACAAAGFLAKSTGCESKRHSRVISSTEFLAPELESMTQLSTKIGLLKAVSPNTLESELIQQRARARPLVKLGDGPDAVVAADFNGDGSVDLAVVNRDCDNVSVYLSDGSGGFGPARCVAVGDGPRALVAADLDRDGRVDLVTANTISDNLTVLFGRGDGGFEPGFPLETVSSRLGTRFLYGLSPRSVIAADFNGDHSLDLATANFSSDDVTVIAGTGDRGFLEPRLYPVDPLFPQMVMAPIGDGPYALAAADFDADGNLDIAAANWLSGDVAVLLGDGRLNFQLIGRFAAGVNPYHLAAADLNRDGIPDLAVASWTSDAVSMLIGNGDGRFQAAVEYPAGDGPTSIVAADLNGDNVLDLVTANVFSDDCSLLLGMGDGTFAAQQIFAAGDGPLSVVAADIDGDGDRELVTANSNSDDITLIASNFLDARILAAGSGPVAILVQDLSGDKYLDIATANADSNNVSVILGSRDGITGQARTFAVGEGPVAIASGDFNSDKVLDLVTADSLSGGISVLLGQGGGGLLPAKTFATGRPEFVNEPMAILAVDLDGDGKTDVATANVTKLPEPAEDYIPDTVSVLIGRGDGTFQSPLNFSVGDAPRGITAADFNGDGFVDIATANSASRQIPGVVAPQDVSILLGRGGGTFFPAQRAIVGGEPSSIIALDLTADGVPDLVTANPGAGTVSVLTGRGDGSFYQSENYTVGGEPVFVTAADLDGDGLHDLATANPATEQVSVLIGDGRGGFFLSAILASAGSADAVAAGDLSGDGKVDLALPNPATDDISILSGPFPGPESIGEGAGTLFVYESDSGSLLSIDMCKTCANSPFLPENTKLHYSRAGLDNELEGQGVIAENPTISFEAIGDQNSLGVTPIALRSPAFKGWFLALESSSRSILAFKKDVDFRRVPPNRSPDREGKPPFPDESSVNFGRGNGLIMSVVITGADIERQIDQQTPRVSRIFELADGRILVFFLTVREVHLLELSLEPLALDFDLDDGDDTAVTVMAPKGKFRVPGDQAFLTFPYIQQKVTQNVEIDLDSFQPILVPRDGPSFCARRGLPEDGKALVFDVGSTTLLEIYEVFDPLSERYRLGDVRAAVTPEELESTIPQARPYYMSAGLYLPDCMPLWVFEENSNTMIQYDAAASGGQEKLSAQVPRDNFIARRRPDVIGRRDTSVIGEETVLVPSLNDIRESRLYFDQGQDQLLGIHYKTGNVVVIADRAHFEAATGRPLADVTFIEKVLSPDDSSEVLRIFDTESTSLVEATLRYTLMPVVDSEN